MNFKIFDIFKNYIYISIMACTSCKNKTNYKDDINEAVSTAKTAVLVFILIWSLLGFYGLYSLITKFI